jgi:hypothetical protein
MVPTLAHAIEKPGAPWRRAGAAVVEREAVRLAESEFLCRLGGWNPPALPASFSPPDRHRRGAR